MKKELEMGASLESTLEECLKHPELLEQFRRLHPRKHYLSSKKRKEAEEKEAFAFFDFCRDYIWKLLYVQGKI